MDFIRAASKGRSNHIDTEREGLFGLAPGLRRLFILVYVPVGMRERWMTGSGKR